MHFLLVYQDDQTKGLRLQASVYQGPFTNCPVWTAFGTNPPPPPLPFIYITSIPTNTSPVTHQSASPTWLVQKSNHRVWLRDIQPYVFCQRYRQENMRNARSGAFEIYFVNRNGNVSFFFPVGRGFGTDEALCSSETILRAVSVVAVVEACCP